MARCFLLAGFYLSFCQLLVAQDLAAVLKAEKARIDVVNKVRPSTVAILIGGGTNGGTGVLISDDGYALTNFHVTQPAGPTMKCGLPDKVLYDAVLVGLDKVGDVALIKLLPKTPGQKFPFAVMADSDTVNEGDWSIAMGNPFLLATDFTPTVTFGLISGVHRYQYPSGVILEYTDCIQIDTSINPGNSGGPLFNMKGELIGINGRGSFDKRGRVNSGVGYAISINQIKNFMGHLKAGIDTDHASLGTLVTTQTESTGISKMRVSQILDESDVYRRGLDVGDELVSFAGRQIGSVNHFKNVLGLYPRGWRVPLQFTREEKDAVKKYDVLARLMGVQRKEVKDPGQPDPEGKPAPAPIDIKKLLGPKGPAAKYFIAKPGFANFYFNKQEKDRLMTAFAKHGNFAPVNGNWDVAAKSSLRLIREPITTKISIDEVKEGAGSKSVVKIGYGSSNPYELEPLKGSQEPLALRMPENSGGFNAALYVYHRLLTMGEKGFDQFHHGGVEPYYPPPADAREAKEVNWGKQRTLVEVLKTSHGPFQTKWYFDLKTAQLVGMEHRSADNEDPCEVFFSDYRDVGGRQLPHRIAVWHNDNHYGTFDVSGYKLAAAK